MSDVSVCGSDLVGESNESVDEAPIIDTQRTDASNNENESLLQDKLETSIDKMEEKEEEDSSILTPDIPEDSPEDYEKKISLGIESLEFQLSRKLSEDERF